MSQSRFNHVLIAQRVSLLRTLERMVNNHSTAEDFLQETYLSERSIDHLEPFVFPTARNLALDPASAMDQALDWLIAIVVPGLPTTEFILLATWAATRSSPRLSAWLENDRLFGPILCNWRNGKIVAPRSAPPSACCWSCSIMTGRFTSPSPA